MRQAGIVAAPGIYALNNMVDRLAEDHKHAKMLEVALNEIENIHVKPVDTNLVISDISATSYNANNLEQILSQKGIKVSIMGDHLFRMVTYYGITTEHIEEVVNALHEVFK